MLDRIYHIKITDAPLAFDEALSFFKKALMPLVAFGGFGRLLDGCVAGFVPVCGGAWLASCPLGHSAIYFNTKNKSLCETQFIYINMLLIMDFL